MYKTNIINKLLLHTYIFVFKICWIKLDFLTVDLQNSDRLLNRINKSIGSDVEVVSQLHPI